MYYKNNVWRLLAIMYAEINTLQFTYVITSYSTNTYTYFKRYYIILNYKM